MQAYSKFNQFVGDLANGVHNLGSDAITIALTDTAPVATNAVLADITEISYTNLSSRLLTTTSVTQTAGTLNAIFADMTLTASGVVPQFRYVVIYNATPTSPLKPLIGWYDKGAEVNMASGETLLIDLDNVNGIFTIT